MSRTDKEIIDEALFHLIYVEKYAQENLNDSVYLDAISMRLSAAINTLNRLPDSLKKELFGKNWHYMRGMRNRVAHGYAVIDPDTIRATVVQELPEIIKVLKSYNLKDLT